MGKNTSFSFILEQDDCNFMCYCNFPRSLVLIHSIHRWEKKCLGMDKMLRDVALILRSVTDITFLVDIGYTIYEGMKKAYTDINEGDEIIPFAKNLARELEWCSLVTDLLSVFPMPQLLVVKVFSKMRGWGYLERRKVLNSFLLSQFLEPYGTSFPFNERSCWYWAYRKHPYHEGCMSTFYCDDHITSTTVIAFLNESCGTDVPDNTKPLFDYGIFLDSLEIDFVASLLFIGIEMDSVETNNVKPGKFNGTNFKRWQRQLKYWLTVLGLVSALEDQTTPDKTTETTSKTKEKMTKEELEYHCHNRILNTKNAKTLWDELEAEYGIEDAGIDRFTISNFNNYMMVENKTVSEQIHEYQDFLRKIELKGTKFSEEFKVSCLIDKLPPSWLNFAKTLRHKQGVLTLTQVLNSLRIEEKHKSSNKPKEEKTNVNLVETSNNRNRFQSGRKSFKRTNRNSQPNHNQFNRNQNRSIIDPITIPMAIGINHASFVEEQIIGPKTVITRRPSPTSPSLSGTKDKVVLKPNDWWLDSGANVHVCFDKRFFKNYQNSSGGSVTLGNDTVAQVRGIGEVELKMTSGKTLTLKDVRHVPAVRRNLISGSSLVKQGYKIVMESNRIVITRNDVFIGKGYIIKFLLKFLNVESCNVWHGRLGHVSLSKIKTLMDLELIPKSNIDLKHKCEVCVQAKQTRNSFKPVERNTQILELIHSDVCDSNRSPTRGGNKYFVTFIDDFSRITLKDNEKTPYELWKRRSPNLRILKVWGCLA
ncbi:hypothetical protein Prudu_35S000400, partial [Prunus dulcis]